MLTLWEDTGAVHVTDLRERLRRTGEAEKIGGLGDIHRLSDPTPDVTAVERHADGIIEVANRRKIIVLSNSASVRAMKGDSLDEILAEIDTGIATIQECAPDPLKDVFDLGMSEGPPPPQEFVLENLIPAGWWTSVYAKTGSAKSFLALYIAFCIVLGRPIFGRAVQQGPVLYLDAELDRHAFESRAWMIARGLGLDRLPHGLYYHRLEGSLTESKSNRRVRRLVDKVRPRLTIIDSFTAAIRGRESNSVDDVTDRLLRWLKGLGSVMIIDHTTSKSSDISLNVTPIGSSAKNFFVRSAIFVASNGKAAILRQDKSTFGPLSEPIKLAFNWSLGSLTFDVLAGDDPRLKGLEQAMTVKDQLRASFTQGDYDEGGTAKDIAAALGAKPGTVQNELRQLKIEGAVRNSGGKWYPASADSFTSLS